MGFWQGLCESYEKNEHALKISDPPYPLSTTSISNNSDSIAIIVIDKDGSFIKSDEIKKTKKDKDPKNKGKYIHPPRSITIPVTEKSSARSSGIEPHPLFDQFDYLKGEGKKFDKYIAQLKELAESNFATDAIKAIYKYVSKKSVEKDLAGLKPKSKTNIIFKVEIPEQDSEIWKDEKLFESWHSFYIREKKEILKEEKLDYISGTKQLESISHPRKIINNSGNAKLISDNDTNNFTFRGKFEVILKGKEKISNEAFSIGYESSQRAHQFLRYLVNDRGFCCDSQVILSYTIGSMKELPKPQENSIKVLNDLDRIGSRSQTQTKIDKQIKLKAETGFDYSEALSKALLGLNEGKTLTNHDVTAVVVLDAASPGRLSVTFYRELLEKDYLEKIADWHSTCKWHFKIFEDKQPINVIETPSIDKIIEAVYGKPRGGQDNNYDKIKKQAREQIIHCIFDGIMFPKNYILNAVHRVSNPLAITDKDGNFNQNSFEIMLCTTCALVKKFFKKEKYQMSLESDRLDRDYLYGRLLGAADKLESRVLREKKEERITNAIRFMNAFSQKPFEIWKDIHEKISIYFQKGGFALSEIQRITNLFKSGDFEKPNKPLNGSYLLGFYHERAEIERLVEESHKTKEKLNQKED